MKRLIVVTASAVSLFWATQALADPPTITTIDFPGSTSTVAPCINLSGTIAGDYLDGSGLDHGYIRAADGTFTSFDPPGGNTSPDNGPDVVGINGSGRIAGAYVDGNNVTHGFVRLPNGAITSFDAPGVGTINGQFTRSLSINSKGVIVGFYRDSFAEQPVHGFVRAADGTINTFDPPGSTFTVPISINDSGAIAGYYGDANNDFHSFVRDSGGTITSFDVLVDGAFDTQATSISDSGVVTGGYTLVENKRDTLHGFLRDSDGTITTFDPPKSFQTGPSGITTQGEIVGSYDRSSKGSTFGFIRTPAGKITSIVISGSNTVVPMGINAKNAIVGYYYDSSHISHGFLRTP